jgi:hypothetical protein
MSEIIAVATPIAAITAITIISESVRSCGTGFLGDANVTLFFINSNSNIVCVVKSIFFNFFASFG